ncbi:MAG: hypothetical protein ACNFW9_03140 [Candidatus Kerfeldbacteria bacterium]
MLETSKDLLNILIGVSVASFAFFICWAIFYLIMILKSGYQATKEITDFVSSLKQKLDKFENLLTTIEEKIKSSTSYIPLIMKGVSELIDYIKNKKESKKKK